MKSYPNAPLYDTGTIRTVFLQFEAADWEQELAAFNNTDVDVPAIATIDGKVYKGVGVHFRGMSSYFMVPEGRKRSLNLSFDFADEKQDAWRIQDTQPVERRRRSQLPASRPLHRDRLALCSDAEDELHARRHQRRKLGAVPQRATVQQGLHPRRLASTKGARWKVPGSPGGQAGFNYLGDNVADYKQFYTITSKDDPKAWADLIKVFKVLKETPPDKLESALAPIFDVDGALKFLAVEVALVNTDGFWTRASDYSLYEDENGKIHIVPHDVNEGMGPEEGGRRGGGPGGFVIRGGGPGGPPPGMGDPNGPPPPPMGPGGPGGRGGFGRGGPAGRGPIWIRSSASTTTARRSDRSCSRCRRCVRSTWRTCTTSPTNGSTGKHSVPSRRSTTTLIAADVTMDTRKLFDNAAFENGIASVKSFVDARRAYLLKATTPAIVRATASYRLGGSASRRSQCPSLAWRRKDCSRPNSEREIQRDVDLSRAQHVLRLQEERGRHRSAVAGVVGVIRQILREHGYADAIARRRGSAGRHVHDTITNRDAGDASGVAARSAFRSPSCKRNCR